MLGSENQGTGKYAVRFFIYLPFKAKPLHTIAGMIWGIMARGYLPLGSSTRVTISNDPELLPMVGSWGRSLCRYGLVYQPAPTENGLLSY